MQTTRPPRPQETVVHLDSRDFTGEMHTICTLDHTPNPRTLRELVAGDQLAVSPCGAYVAMVLFLNPHQERITHNGMLDAFLFDRHRPEEGARILAVGEREVLVWGKAEGRPQGIWLLTPGMRLYLHPLETLHGFLGCGRRVAIGASSLYPGELSAAMPWGLWPVRLGSKVEVSGDYLYVLEPIDGSWYAYRTNGDGASGFTQVHDSDPLRLLPWGSGMALVSRFGGRALVDEVGAPSSLCKMPVPIDGQVKDAWGSPSPQAEALALLVAPRVCLDEDILRLYLDREVLYEGRFTMHRDDLFWSKSGASVAARIRLPGNRERIVTPCEERALPVGTSLREVLVSDSGHILATIVTDGTWDRPMLMGGRRGTAVPMAWNLHEGADGSIVWNTVHDGMILRWIDRTHQLAAHAVYTTAR